MKKILLLIIVFVSLKGNLMAQNGWQFYGSKKAGKLDLIPATIYIREDHKKLAIKEGFAEVKYFHYWRSKDEIKRGIPRPGKFGDHYVLTGRCFNTDKKTEILHATADVSNTRLKVSK